MAGWGTGREEEARGRSRGPGGGDGGWSTDVSHRTTLKIPTILGAPKRLETTCTHETWYQRHQRNQQAQTQMTLIHYQVTAQVAYLSTQMESAHSQVSAQVLFTQNMWQVPSIVRCKHTEQKGLYTHLARLTHLVVSLWAWPLACG